MADIQPWPFDILTRVIKIVRAGGGFVCGGQTNQLNHAAWTIYRKGAANTAWQQVFNKTEADRLQLRCGAYGAVGADPENEIAGQPTFITAGGRQQFNVATLETEAWQVIMTSIGGETWTETHRESGGYCYVAGWHETEKKFYVQCIADSSGGTSNYVVLASSDGLSWSRAATTPGAFGGTHAEPLLEATGIPIVQDSNGQIVPNGGYYGKNGPGDSWSIIIKPQHFSPYFTSFVGAGATNVVEIIKKTIDPETGEVTITMTTKTLPMDQVICVACAGGIWQAGGFMGEGTNPAGGVMKIAISTDDGDTWQEDYTGEATTYALCLMGATDTTIT